VESEDVVYNSLISWIKHDIEARKPYFPTLFKLIRLQHVSYDCLSDEIRKEVSDSKAYLQLIASCGDNRTNEMCIVFIHFEKLTSNVPSKSLLSVRGMEGHVSSNLKGGACVRLKARI